MVYIAGAGFAYPENNISNEFLEELGLNFDRISFEGEFGIYQRRTSLPLTYIRDTRNRNSRECAKVALETPTDLAVRAARQAIERAEISIDQIKMIIGNCETPLETTPSEAQRVGKVLGLKVPAFDISASHATFFAQLDALSRYNESELPEYGLCFSTALFTQAIDYSSLDIAPFFGDGAGAVVFSRANGSLRVLDTLFESRPVLEDGYHVSTCGRLGLNGNPLSRERLTAESLSLMSRLSERESMEWTNDIFIGDQIDNSFLGQLSTKLGIDGERNWRNLGQYGSIGGGSFYAILGMNWERAITGRRILLCSALNSFSLGGVILGT